MNIQIAKMVLRKIIGPLSFVLFFVVIFNFLPQSALAQVGDLSAISDQTGLTSESPLLIIARVIRVILSMLGILLVCLIIYAGVLWMTAGGNTEKVQKAKRILINAVIGLFIILASVAITTFIMSALSRATGSNVGGDSGSGGGGGGLGGGGGASSFTVSKATEGDYAIYNILPQVQFSRNYDPETIENSVQLFNSDTGEEVSINIQRSNPYQAEGANSNSILYLVPETTCPEPNQDIFCLDQNTNYRLTVIQGTIKSSTGVDLVCSSVFAPCEFDFSTGDILDLTRPTAEFEAPDAGARVPANSVDLVQVVASDDSGISSAEIYSEGSGIAGISITQIDDENYLIESGEWSTGTEENVNILLETTVTDVAGNVGTARRSVRVSPAHCFNGQLDADSGETGIDCGGDCGLCNLSPCTDNSECSSGVCSNGICIAPPKITGMNPVGGGIGTYVLLTGDLLSNSGTVYFTSASGLVEALRPACAAGIEGYGILVEVPEGAVDGPVTFESPSGLRDSTNDNFGELVPSEPALNVGIFDVNDVRRPNLCTVSPNAGQGGNIISLTGEEFATDDETDLQGDGRVDFERLQGQCSNGSGSCFMDSDCSEGAVCEDKGLSGVVYSGASVENYESWTDSLVRFFLDNSLPDSDYFVRVTQEGQSSNPLPFFVRSNPEIAGSLANPPQISSISHDNGAIGDYLTIRGSNFGDSGQVFFDSTSTSGRALGDDNFPAQCSPDALWSNTKVIIRVPAEYANQEDEDIEFETHGLFIQRAQDSAVSNTVNFDIRDQSQRPGLCSIDPGTANVGDQVDIFGSNLPVSDDEAKVVFTPNLEISNSGPVQVISWISGNRVATNIPEGANSGQVYVETSEGVRSNSVDLNVGSLDEVATIDTQISHYGWTFSTGVIPPKPNLIVACDAENSVYSALPNSQFDDEVCRNVLVQAQFDIEMDSESIASGVTIHECLNERCNNISDPIPSTVTASERGFSLVVQPREASLAGFEGYSEVNGAVYMKADTEYFVNVSSEVLSEAGEPLGEDFSWRFRVGGEDDICEIESVKIQPPSKIFSSFGEESDFNALPLARECVPISDQLRYRWNHPSSITERRACDPNRSSCAQLTSVSEGDGNLVVNVGAQITDTAEITVQLEEYFVERIYPDCGSACRNSDVRIVFSRPVDSSCSSSACIEANGNNRGASDDLLAGMELRLCEDESCESSSLIETQKFCLVESGGGCKEYSLDFDGLLEANAEYKVLVYADVFSIDGQQLTGLNGPFVYAHEFSTSDKICAPSAISLRPASATAGSTEDYQAFIADARSTPDTCSEVGQIIDSKDLNWEWDPIKAQTIGRQDIKLAEYFFRGRSLLDAGVDAICADILVKGGSSADCDNYERISRVGPVQVLEITSDAPRLVDSVTKSAETSVIATASEAVQGVQGTASYKLLCSATSDAQCPAGQGVGENNCCSLKPVLNGSDPANGQTNVCRNKLFELEFNTAIDESSIEEGIAIIFSRGVDECPANHDLVFAETGRPVGLFARIFRNIIPSVFAQEATECRLPIQRSSQTVNEDKSSTIKLFTGELLASGSRYQIRVNENLKSDLGVSANSGVVTFISGSEICLVDEVKVDDPEAEVAGYFNISGETRPFEASALSYSGGTPQSIQPIEGVYSWEWQTWEQTGVDFETDESVELVAIEDQEVEEENFEAEITAQDQAGEGYVFSSLVIEDATGIDQNGRIVYGNLPITTFFCEAPWPSLEAFPFIDGIAYGQEDITEETGAIRGDAWTHFSMMYCKDNGLEETFVNEETGRQETVRMDLPGLRLTLADDKPEGVGVIKEYLFNVEDTQDLIAVRVLSNPDYLSPLEWYSAQGFTGSPESISIDGFPALREGRSVYIFAPNQAVDEDDEDSFVSLGGDVEATSIFPNVYVLSYNQSAETSTVRIWEQIIRNFELAVNVRDERVCSLPDNQGEFVMCSSDFDCAGENNICLSDKLKLQRDAQRILDVIDVARKAEDASAPRLNAGTFVAGMTTSAWPSWLTTFAGELGGVPVDPLNRFGECPDGYDAETCFNANLRQFVCTEDSSVYKYRIQPLGDFEVSARLEYRDAVWGRDLPSDVINRVNISSPPYLSSEEEQLFRAGFGNENVCTGAIIGDSAVCGDGIVGGDEVCEPGLPSGFEACTTDSGQTGQRALGCASDCSGTISVESNTCVPQRCNNGIIDPGEICDDGANNGQYGFCGINCNYEPGFGGASFCGDGVLNAGEACDCGAPGLAGARSGVDLAGNTCVVKNGQYSSNRSETCSWDCRGPAVGFCGNGLVESASGEECDGVETRDAGTGRVCLAGDPGRIGQLCSSNAECNTVIETGLLVNDGVCSNEAVPLIERRACHAPGTQNACKYDGDWGAPQASNDCGNGQLEEGEECDDGNDNTNDSCTNLCRLNVCGDGIVNVGIEGCDAGAENGQTCSAPYGGTCSFCSQTCNTQVVSGAYCGDGQIQQSFELCDASSLPFEWWVLDNNRSGRLIHSNGACAPNSDTSSPRTNYGARLNQTMSFVDIKGDQRSGQFDSFCVQAGVCVGGSNDGYACNFSGLDNDKAFTCPGGTCRPLECNGDCQSTCPFDYESSLVQFRANLEGSQRSGTITLSNLDENSAFSPLNSPNRAEVYIPACTVAEGLVGDVSFQNRETEDLLLTFVLDFSGSMGQDLGGRSRYQALLENLDRSVEKIFDELGEKVSIRLVIYSGDDFTRLPSASYAEFTYVDPSQGYWRDLYPDFSFGVNYNDSVQLDTSISSPKYNSYNPGFRQVHYSNSYTIDSEDTLDTLIKDLKNANLWTNIPGTSRPGTNTAQGFMVASDRMYDEYESRSEDSETGVRQAIVLMTDGLFDNMANPALGACRAMVEKGQEVFTLTLLPNGSQSTRQSSVFTRTSLLGATMPSGLQESDCARLLNASPPGIWNPPVPGSTQPFNMPLYAFSGRSGYDLLRRATFHWNATLNTITHEAAAALVPPLDVYYDYDHIDLMALISSGNPHPETGVDYAHTAKNDAEFTEAFDNIVNSIINAQINYLGSDGSESFSIEEGFGVPLPLPEDFVCTDREQIVPITASFAGEGSIQISNVRFNYCPY